MSDIKLILFTLALVVVSRPAHSFIHPDDFATQLPNNDDAPASRADWNPLPDDYEQRTAAQKLKILWSLINDTEYGGPDSGSNGAVPGWAGQGFNHPGQKVKGLLTMDQSFDHFSDLMPPERAKFIHTYGVVGQMEYKPVAGVQYTGLFKTGAIGLIRMSLAADPRLPVPGNLPGIAIKLLRDGMVSTNTVALYTLDGNRRNTNFFYYPLQTWVPWPKNLLVNVLALLFNLAENGANILPVRDFALFDDHGVSVQNASWPNLLSFEPDDRLKDLIPEDADVDTRYYLLKIQPGRLFKVYAQTDLDDLQSRQYIADVNLIDSFKASAFGDAHLFFRHQRKHPKRPDNQE